VPFTVGHWTDQAACKGKTAIFFPERHVTTYEAASAICATCPVVKPCLERALVTGERHGFWGGMTPNQLRLERSRRKIIIADRRDEVTSAHGTALYRRGCRCQTCRDAVSAANRRRRAERTNKKEQTP